MDINWTKEFDAAITICSEDGKIIYMNDKSVKTFEKDGGENLIGTNIFDCHPEPAKQKLYDLIKNKQANCYSIEKNGLKKLIYQSPWYDAGTYKGIIELSITLPDGLQNFIRE